MLEWMFMICDFTWKQKEVPDEWKKTIIVTQHKGQGSKDECNNYRGISLLIVPRRVCVSLGGD